MTINHKCKYYKRDEVERNDVRNTFDDDESIILHSCYHPQNTKVGQLNVTSKDCDVGNDYCPHNSNSK